MREAYRLQPESAEDAEAWDTGTRIQYRADSITDMNRGRMSDPNHIQGHS